jgi:hypothetical protein
MEPEPPTDDNMDRRTPFERFKDAARAVVNAPRPEHPRKTKKTPRKKRK